MSAARLAPARPPRWPFGRALRKAFGPAMRSVPIRWRILGIAVANSALAVMLLLVIASGAKGLATSWADLRRVQESERLLSSLGGDAERLQGLIHRYFSGNDPAILARIVALKEALSGRLRVQARLDALLSEPSRELTEITDRFVKGFESLRDTRDEITQIYRSRILQLSKEMSGLYSIVGSSTVTPGSLMWPALGKSREAFNDMLIAANNFYLSGSAAAASEAQSNAAAIRRTAPVILDMSDEPIQQRAVGELETRAKVFSDGIDELSAAFQKHNRLLTEVVDGNAEAMLGVIDRMRAGIRDIEQSTQLGFDRTIEDVAIKLGLLSLVFVVLVVAMGFVIAWSISDPLDELRSDMMAVMNGRLEQPVAGLAVRDEVGDMARAVDVFRDNAVAKRRAEEELRTAKDDAEASLAEIREMQTTLIEAEKFAALGGLVAGVAHEVNNPVGISLTVASSLATRAETFAAEVAAGRLRRSQLDDFTGAARTASTQLVANLHRAAELIQSFKQVAADRSHAERRVFDLAVATEQILASLRPTLKTTRIKLVVDIPDGITMDSYPGALGQILTNLFLNAAHHAFGEDGEGTITIVARISGENQVRLVFRDDGGGMREEVQRQAFEPFFTTRRGAGGTGLGLHIVYNLVTRSLGGRIALSSEAGMGASFMLVLPQHAPEAGAAPVRPRSPARTEAHAAS